MKIEMLGYVAGVLEGEGCFTTQTNGYSPKIQVSMTDLDVLERVQDYFSCGNIVPIKKRQAHWKDAWIWRCSGNDAATVMDAIYPYMSARRKEKIDEVRKTWYDRLDVVDSRQARALAAAREHLSTGESLRKVAERHGVSHETVRKAVFAID